MTNPLQSTSNNHNFAHIPTAEIPRSSFNRNHSYKTTFNAGDLIPFFADEALPGDTFNLKCNGFARLATPIFPIMDHIHAETFFFAVPMRLLWENWEKFMGERKNPTDSIDYLCPQITTTIGFEENSIYDYLGLPTLIPNISINSFHLRAYNLIYNEWFRDQNLQDSIIEHYDDGVTESEYDYVIKKRGKRHDYFTSCLPWPQKGDSINLPLGQRAPITGLSVSNGSYIQSVGGTGEGWETDKPGIKTNYQYFKSIGDNDGNVNNRVLIKGPDNGTAGLPEVYADLTQATASTVNELRQAFQLQKMLERDARGGTRYTEMILSHFGVTSPDSRMQRPEYLGGGSTNVQITPLPNLNGDSFSRPQGDNAAMGTLSFTGHGFEKSFTEHCVILGFISARADMTYQNGINKMWSRQIRYDYYFPTLAHIGEQAVLSQEIFTDGTSDDELVFGYQERYAEYRYKPSIVTSLMRSQSIQSLDAWHLAQDFLTRPFLSSSFIEENPPIDRVIAVPGQPHFILDTFFELTCARPMPVHSIPGMIDHF
ncbi:major capsid protein [Microviridae sp.]|nr:major capsid protein [Microviridae sp.]